jgi:hypothetical protein
MKWVTIVLIVGPIILFMLLGIAASKTADGGLILVLLAPLFAVPIVLGLLIGVVRAIFVLKTPGQNGSHPVKSTLAAMFIILVLGSIGGVAYVYIHHKEQMKKDAQALTISQQQAVQLIQSCKINYLYQQPKEIDLVFSQDAAPAAAEESGISSYKTTMSNWAVLANAANEASKKCGFIEADNLQTSFTWISMDEAQQLLLACKIQEVHGYFDGVSQDHGKTVLPTGKHTGIALFDPGNNKIIYMTDNVRSSLKATVTNAQQKCGIGGLTDTYTPL